MKPSARVMRPTPQGWTCLALATLALSSLFWPGKPMLFSIGIAILIAIGVALWLVPRRLHLVTTRWLESGPIHAGDDIALGALVTAPHQLGPMTLGAHDPNTDRLTFITDLPGVSPTPTQVVWPMRFVRRGVFNLEPLIIRNEQPFGMIQAQRPCGEHRRVIVRPALGKVTNSLTEQLRRWLEEGGLSPEAGDDDVSHVRPYRPGDPKLRINWRASARARQLLVTQRQAPASQHIAIVLDTRGRHPRSKRFERLLSAAATLIDHLAAEGWQLSLHGLFAPAGIRGGRELLIDTLAEVHIDVTASGMTQDLSAIIPRNEPCLILATDDPGPLPVGAQGLVLTLSALAEHMHLPRVEA